jgi:hypothetical protein
MTAKSGVKFLYSEVSNFVSGWLQALPKMAYPNR